MKRFHDPTPALQRPKDDLPLSEWIKAILSVAAVVALVAASVYMDHHR